MPNNTYIKLFLAGFSEFLRKKKFARTAYSNCILSNKLSYLQGRIIINIPLTNKEESGGGEVLGGKYGCINLKSRSVVVPTAKSLQRFICLFGNCRGDDRFLLIFSLKIFWSKGTVSTERSGKCVDFP